MLTARVDGPDCLVRFEGSVTDACAELSAVITGVYNGLAKENKDSGECFKFALTEGFIRGICFGISLEEMAECVDCILKMHNEDE